MDNDLENCRMVNKVIEDLFTKNGSSREAPGMGADVSQVAAHKNEKLLPNGTKPGQKGSLSDITTVLTQFVEHILNHPAVRASPECYQGRLAFELKACLSAHVTQAEDNYNYMRQCIPASNGPSHPQRYTRPGRTFYNWARSTSADHTSCLFSFVFFNSLLYSTTIHHKQNSFGKSRAVYVAEDLCRHLSSLCRMYNDYGSSQRDSKENNLNSTNFPEFAPLLGNGTGHDGLSPAKAELLWVAEYERRGVETSLDILGKELADHNQQHVIDGLKFFINITDLFCQVYVVNDVGLRNKYITDE